MAKNISIRPKKSALSGELGSFINKDKTISTERSITVTDPRINEGKPTNIPQLVHGQSPKNIKTILSGKISKGSQESAIRRAAFRKLTGASLPSYDTIPQAEKAAAERSKSKGKPNKGVKKTLTRKSKPRAKK